MHTGRTWSAALRLLAGGGTQTHLSEIKASSFFACFYCDKVMIFWVASLGNKSSFSPWLQENHQRVTGGRTRSRTSNAQVPSPVHGLVQQDLKNISDSTHSTARIQPPLHRSHLPTGLPAVARVTKIPLAPPDTNT